MRVYYVLTRETEKGISARFIEAPAVKVEGSDMIEVIKLATEALSSMLVLGLDGYDYRTPYDYEQIRDMAMKGETVVPVIITEVAKARYRR